MSIPDIVRALPSRVTNPFIPLQQHIRYLLSTGKTQWESMERYIDGM